MVEWRRARGMSKGFGLAGIALLLGASAPAASAAAREVASVAPVGCRLADVRSPTDEQRAIAREVESFIDWELQLSSGALIAIPMTLGGGTTAMVTVEKRSFLDYLALAALTGEIEAAELAAIPQQIEGWTRNKLIEVRNEIRKKCAEFAAAGAPADAAAP